jgi:predicted ArsR family transcriptional regulator
VENWALLTDRARVLLAIAGDPGIRLRDIAATLGITERSACAIVTDLAGAGYVAKHKDGRRKPLPDPGPPPAARAGQPATHYRRAARPPQQPARDHRTQVTGAPAREVAGLGTGRVITARARTCSAEVTQAAGTKWQ